MRVVGVRGENTYELDDGYEGRHLYTLPRRLRHVVFIRPGSYVLALRDDQLAERGSKIVGEIQTAILDTHLAELRKHLRWPPVFAKIPLTLATPTSKVSDALVASAPTSSLPVLDSGDTRASFGVVAEQDFRSGDESDLECNPNQRKADRYESSSDDEK
jgi:hypothetical protein